MPNSYLDELDINLDGSATQTLARVIELLDARQITYCQRLTIQAHRSFGDDLRRC